MRPPIAADRLHLTADGQVVLDLRHRWADGTTQLLFEPVELLERLAALTPRPPINLLLYYGVLGARSAWRSRLQALDPENQRRENPANRSYRPSRTPTPCPCENSICAAAPLRISLRSFFRLPINVLRGAALQQSWLASQGNISYEWRWLLFLRRPFNQRRLAT